MLTTLVAVVLAFGPGGLLGFVVPAGRLRWAVWSAAPILTLGLTATAMGWLAGLGLPDGVGAVLVVELALAAGALLVSRSGWLLARRRTTAATASATPVTAASRRTSVGRQLPRLIDLAAVTVPALICVALGRSLLGGFRYPPGWDAMNHAVLTRNILATGSTGISSVCISGAPPAKVSCEFYPLAADVQWAQAAHLAGGSISTAMTAWSVVIGPLALVLGIYAALRSLRATPWVAGAAAVAPAVLGPLWTAELTGRITEGVGPGLSVGVALLSAMALRDRTATTSSRVRLGLLAGLGVTGILLTHTYEVLFAATLTLALVAVMGRAADRADRADRSHGRREFVQSAWPGAVAVVAATMVTVGPFLNVLVNAKTERSVTGPRFPGDFWHSFEYWVTDPQRYVLLGYPAPGTKFNSLTLIVVQIGLFITIPCLIAALFSFWVRGLRWARPWVAVWALWTAVGVWTGESASGPAQALSGFWYGEPERLRTMILPVYGVMAVAGACVIGIVVRTLAGGFSRRRADPRPAASAGRGRQLAAGIGAGVLVAALLALIIPGDARIPLYTDLARRTPTTKSYPEAFRWLAAHTPKQDVVASNRNTDMMTWLYADYGVRPLYGIPPLVKASMPSYNQRWDAFYWLVNAAGHGNAACAVKRLQIDYLVTGQDKVPGWARGWKTAEIKASPNLRLVKRFGGVKIYQVTPAGRACSTA